MTLAEVTPYIKEGKWGLLPNYKGYFKWDYHHQCVYMQNKDYKKYNLQDEKLRNDFFYII